MKFAAIGPSAQARDFLSSSSFSRSSARVNEKNVCVRNFSDRRKRATEFEATRRRPPKTIKVKPLFSLSLSLSSGKRMKTGRKATRNRTREGVLGLTFLCVCVCSRAAFFSSRSACDVCSVSRKTSKKVRVMCKNYEEGSTKKLKKGKKSGKTKRRAKKKKTQ